MKFALLAVLCLAALVAAQTLCIPGEYENGYYTCNNNPTVILDLDDDEGTFTAIYSNGCTYAGDALVDDDGNMEVTSVNCRNNGLCADVGFNCDDFIVTDITFDDNSCDSWTGTRNGATLNCVYDAQEDDDSAAAFVAPILAVIAFAALFI